MNLLGPSHFARMFRKLVGIPPSKFRASKFRADARMDADVDALATVEPFTSPSAVTGSDSRR